MVSALEQLLYFLHIPKTAGTSVIEVLDRRFAPPAILPAQLLPELAALSAEEIRRARFVRGHLGARLGEALGVPTVTFTLLRDPVDRTVSHFLHARREPGHYLHAHVNRPGYALGDFVADARTRPLVENFQARFLALSAQDAPATAEGYAGHPLERQIAYELGPLPADLERAALQGLSEIDVAWVVEDGVEAGLGALARRMGWDGVPPVPHRRVAVQRAPVAPELRERIHALTAVDAALVAAVRARGRAAAPVGWCWDAAREAAGNRGWHPAQFHEALGWHRWTGPDPVSIAPLEGGGRLGSAALRIDLLDAARPELIETLNAEVDGRAVPLARVPAGLTPISLEGRVTLTGRPAAVRLRSATAPVAGASGPRTVPAGVAVARIALRPAS
jgi:hypothetical protein